MNTSAKTILLVEDEAIIALAEKRDLAGEGFNVVVAHSGEEAIMKVEADPDLIDLILMDINLGPGIDGAEAAQIILRSHDIPIIFLSSHIEPEIVDKVERITSYGYVVKGSSETVLFASIRMAFRLYEANKKSRINEAALRESEEKFRRLFENMTAGLVLNEIIYDEYGRPCDYRNIEVNPAFEKITGLSASQVKNKTARELNPNADINWIREHLKIAHTGKPLIYENYFPSLGKYLEVMVYSSRKDNTASILYDITERKKAQEKLTYSYNLLSYFIKHARSAIAIHDRNLKFLYVSDEYIRQYNLKDSDIIGRHHYEIFPDLPEKWREVHWKALNGVTSGSEMDSYPKEDGTVEWTSWDCRPWYEADGNIGGIIVNTEVITEKVQALERLNRYAKIFENAKWGLTVWSRDFQKIEMANPEYARMHGYSVEEMIGMRGAEVYPPEEKENLGEQLCVLQEKGYHQFESMHIRKDGSVFPVRIEINSIKDDANNVLYHAANVIDITERKKTEEHLRKLSYEIEQSENKFRTLFEDSPVGIIITRDGNVLNINKACCEMFGYSDPGEILGRSVIENIVPEERHLVLERIRVHRQGEKKRNKYSFTALRKDGTKFPVSVAVDYVSIQEGEFSVSFISDMTEIVEKEEVIKASLKEKELLLKEIHHRVKNNLQIISSLLSLQSDRSGKSSYEEAFRESQNRIKSISLVHEKLYRSDNLSKIDISDYIQTLIIFLKKAYAVDNSRVEVRSDCDRVNMPIDAAIPCGLILNEVVSNAFKYAFSNSDGGVLTYSVKNRKDEIEIRIKDNGPGLPDGMDLKGGDTLGQLIISSLVAQLGGRAEIKNDAGMEYILTIPVKWEKN